MASLVLRGDTWHLMWRWRGQLKSQSTKVQHDGKSKNGKPIPPPDARRQLKKLENSLDQGKSYDSQTLNELLDLVEKDYEVHHYRSAPSLHSRLDHIKEWFGNIRADRITDNDFLEYAAARQAEEASNTTINRELEVVMKALRLGKVQPLPTFKKLKQPPAREGFFDDQKIAAVTAHLPEYLRAPFLFGYYTGWRREEVFSLEWSQIDFNVGEIRLYDSKNGLPRIFPMEAVPELRPLLLSLDEGRKRLQHVGHIVPWVFARYVEETNTVRRIVDFRKALRTACTAADCPGMIFHDLRRSAARQLENAGWTRSQIMEWLGHETESMFHRYRIVSAADREIVRKRVAELRHVEALRLAADHS